MTTAIKKLNKNLIAITIGDIEGIGIYLLMKEYNKNKIKNFVLITNLSIFKKKIRYSDKKINIIDIKKFNYDKEKLNILTFKTKNQNTNTLDALNVAYKLTKNNYFIGILTLPLNKNKIYQYVNKDFIDQTTYFSKLEKSKNSNMFFIHKNKYFIPLTIHIELKKVYKYFINKKNIKNKILSIVKTLNNDFKINDPKILIAGINPHAGEKGMISKDEIKYLNPVINFLKKNKINVTGPISGDGMININNLKDYDVFLFPYHDQALIPFKLISNYGGVNYTSNLSIIRTSPSHGTAENLIGEKNASSKGILNSFKLINYISKNRKQN